MLFVACLRSPALYFATQQSVEKNPEKSGQFLSWYSHVFSFKQVFLWSKAKNCLPKQHSTFHSKMESAAALQSEHSTERLQLPAQPRAHWTDVGPVPALGHGWRARTLNSSSLLGLCSFCGSFPGMEEQQLCPPRTHREGLPSPGRDSTPSLLHPCNV